MGGGIAKNGTATQWFWALISIYFVGVVYDCGRSSHVVDGKPIWVVFVFSRFSAMDLRGLDWSQQRMGWFSTTYLTIHWYWPQRHDPHPSSWGSASNWKILSVTWPLKRPLVQTEMRRTMGIWVVGGCGGVWGVWARMGQDQSGAHNHLQNHGLMLIAFWEVRKGRKWKANIFHSQLLVWRFLTWKPGRHAGAQHKPVVSELDARKTRRNTQIWCKHI